MNTFLESYFPPKNSITCHIIRLELELVYVFLQLDL